MRRRITTFAAVLAAVLTGCTDELPTSTDEDLFPVTARSVEVRIPFSEFGTDLRVLGGFGSPVELNQGIVAREFEDVLNARTLSRFQRYPRTASVRDTTGTLQTDSSLTFVGGRVVVSLDTVNQPEEPILFRAGALQEPWHPRTTSWEWAVDTVGTRTPWPEPGAGPVTLLDTATWDPAEGDTVSFDVDSATVAAWADSTDHSRGVRIEVADPGTRVRIRTVDLRLNAESSINPDTTVVVSTGPRDLTFVYDPIPEPPPDGIRLGGVPAWRTVFRVEVPSTLEGPPELCEALGCPFEVTEGAVNFAALVLTTRQSPTAFQPDDTLAMDVRPVLVPERLPKSPLGNSLLGRTILEQLRGRQLPPSYFTTDPGQQIIVPITGFVRDAVRGETGAGRPAPEMIALLSAFEPVSLHLASFEGPGSEAEPVLRLILSRDEGVQLP